MASQLQPAEVYFADQNGRPLVGGKVYFYFPGTENKKDTWKDQALTIPNTNPVVLDARGNAIIWGSGTYRQVLTDANDVLIWDQLVSESGSTGAGNTTIDYFVPGDGVAPHTFVPDTTKTLTLSGKYGSLSNIEVYFDGAYQQQDQLLSLVDNALTFNSAIPSGIQRVEVRGGLAVPILTPPNGSVGDSALAWGTILNRVVSSVAELKGLDPAKYKRAFVLGYFKPGDGGGGPYFYDSTIDASKDNGGSIIRATTSGCWMLTLHGYMPAEAFGLPSDSTVDASAVCQRAIDAAQALDLKIIFPPHLDLKLLTGLTMKQGQNATDTMKWNPKIDFNGALLRPGPGVTAFSIVPRCLLADAGTGRGYSEFYLGNVSVDGFYADGTSSGITIGQPGTVFVGINYEHIENITIKTSLPAGFTGITLQDCQHFKIDRVSCYAPFYIQTFTTGGFCGDFVFTALDTIGTTTRRPLVIRAIGGTSTSGAVVAGIKFNQCELYGSGYLLTTGGYGNLGDIWFNHCQWDTNEAATGQVAVELSASDNSHLFDVHFIHPYFVEYKGCIIKAYTANAGVMDTIFIDTPYVGYSDLTTSPFNAGMYFQNVEFELIGGNFISCTGNSNTSLVMAQDCGQGFGVALLAGKKLTNVQHGVTVAGASNNYQIVQCRMGVVDVNPVNDIATGVPNKNTTPNMHI